MPKLLRSTFFFLAHEFMTPYGRSLPICGVNVHTAYDIPGIGVVGCLSNPSYFLLFFFFFFFSSSFHYPLALRHSSESYQIVWPKEYGIWFFFPPALRIYHIVILYIAITPLALSFFNTLSLRSGSMLQRRMGK